MSLKATLTLEFPKPWVLPLAINIFSLKSVHVFNTLINAVLVFNTLCGDPSLVRQPFHFCMGFLTQIRTMPAFKDTGYGLPNLLWNKINENILARKQSLTSRTFLRSSKSFSY